MLKSDKISGKGDVGRRFCAGATAWLRGYDSSLAWAVGRGSGRRGAEKGENMKRKTEMARPRSFFCSGPAGRGAPRRRRGRGGNGFRDVFSRVWRHSAGIVKVSKYLTRSGRALADAKHKSIWACTLPSLARVVLYRRSPHEKTGFVGWKIGKSENQVRNGSRGRPFRSCTRNVVSRTHSRCATRLSKVLMLSVYGALLTAIRYGRTVGVQ